MKEYEGVFTVNGYVEYRSVTWIGNSFANRGCAQASLMPERYWYLNRVVVTNSADRGRGIGGNLLRILQQDLKENFSPGKLVVDPGGYGSDPEDLIKFYKKFGFEETEEPLRLTWFF
jgi:ribosomal protein S18 acetylase RimI-like enzyme